MKNREFHFKLRKLRTAGGERWTVGRIASTIYVGRSRLNDVLNNKKGHGGQTRAKVVKFFDKHMPEQKAELMAAMGWSVEGGAVVVKPESGST